MRVGDLLKGVAVLVVAVAITAALILGIAHHQATVFNKHTGGSVTMYDAVFVSLRIDCTNIKKEVSDE